MNISRRLWFIPVILLTAIVMVVVGRLPKTHADPLAACSGASYVSQTFANGSNWEMCWEHRQLEGIVLYDVYYTSPDNVRRKVLAQASIAQVHVPYDDNGARFHDVTDYGFGSNNMLSLTSADCPNGSLLTYSTKNVLCKQLQKRGYAYKAASAQKQAEQLALFSVSAIGEYNYIPKWQFFDDGTIDVGMGASGQLQRRGSSGSYGWLINNGTSYGISHIHNYYWRLDFDLGGNGAGDKVEELEFTPTNGNNNRTLVRTAFTAESARSVEPNQMRSWRIYDPNLLNSDGHPISYEVEPLYTGHRDTGPSYEPWTLNDLYVTVYNACEKFASHNPTTSGCAADLSGFVNGQTISSQDTVLWYGLTFHHTPRDEDEPYMHTHWNNFRITPRDWSATNPLATTGGGQATSVAPTPTTPSSQPQTIFSDNFETNLGWTVNPSQNDTATLGNWERAIPETTTYNGAKQLTAANGSYDLVTGRLAGTAAGSYDIDGGVTSIRSPNIVLPQSNNIALSFAYYFSHWSNSGADDYLRVSVVGQTGSQILLEELGNANNDDASWQTFNGNLNAFAGQTVYLLIQSADVGTASLVEAAIDDLLIIATGVTPTITPISTIAPTAVPPTPTIANTPTSAPLVCAVNGLLYERWENLSGSAVSDLTTSANYPNRPTSSSILFDFELPTNSGDSYGVRLRGQIVAPITGNYTFWIASDDTSELYLSTTPNSAEATRIAYVPSWSNSREFDKFPEQKSAVIALQAGKKYYIEVLMKEWGGGDNLSVAWQPPSGTRDVIANDYLCALQLVGSAPTASFTASPSTGNSPLNVTFNASASADADGALTSYAWTFGDGTTGTGINAQHSYAYAGSYTIRLTVTDTNGSTDTTTRIVSVTNPSQTCATTGISRQWWTNVSGESIANLQASANYPNVPSGNDLLTEFAFSSTGLDNYGMRLQGYLYPPVTGSYTFWIASDDNGELWLSSSNTATNATKIAQVSSWVGEKQWDWYTEQKSAVITLQAGQPYYIEALMKEATGGDHLSIAWQLAGTERQIIPGIVVCPLTTQGSAPTASFTATPMTGTAPLTVVFNGSASADSDGTISSYNWSFGNGATASGATTSYTFTAAGSYTVRLNVTDSSGLVGTTTKTIIVNSASNSSCTTTNGLLWEYWLNINGGSVADLTGNVRYPASADGNQLLTNFSAPTSFGEYYGSRTRGYIIPPTSGNYTFWITSDDQSSLRLSTNDTPANAVEIASVPNWTPYEEYGWFPQQQSAVIALQAGQKYYVEMLFKEGFGSDHANVSWTPPNGTRTIIPQSALCAWATPGLRADQYVETVRQTPPYWPLTTAPAATSIPTEYYDDLAYLLLTDQALRDQLLALESEMEGLLEGDGLISAEFIMRATNTLNNLIFSLPEESQSWFLDKMTALDLPRYEGERAVTAWQAINEPYIVVQPTQNKVFLPIIRR